MTLHERIFPTTPDPRLVQARWAAGWGEAVSGFGYAAELLTRRREDFGATLDQAGIAIIFLQRHRAELVLKDLLYQLAGKAPSGHDLDKLWVACGTQISPLDQEAWSQFSAHRELIDVLHHADRSSTVFRYPQKVDGSNATRPNYIDLDELQKALEEFESAATRVIDYISDVRAAGP